jgi:hypothetical protein
MPSELTLQNAEIIVLSQLYVLAPVRKVDPHKERQVSNIPIFIAILLELAILILYFIPLGTIEYRIFILQYQ